MLCRKRGTQVPDDSISCPGCGAPVKVHTTNPGSASQPQPVPVRSASRTSPNWIRGHKATAICLALMLVLSLASCGGSSQPSRTTGASHSTSSSSKSSSKSSSGGSSTSPAEKTPSDGGNSSDGKNNKEEGPVAIPDPGAFFGVEPDSVVQDGNDWQLSYTMVLNQDAIDQYLEVLSDPDRYPLIGSMYNSSSDPSKNQSWAGYIFFYTSPGNWTPEFLEDGSGNLSVKVTYRNDSNDMELLLRYSDDFVPTDSGVQSASYGKLTLPGASSTSSKSSASSKSSSSSSSKSSASSKSSSSSSSKSSASSKLSSSSSSKSSASSRSSSSSSSKSSASSKSNSSGSSSSSTTVPNLGLFLGGPARTNDTSSTDTYAYSLDEEKGLAAIDEYRKLLTSNYNFKEANSEKNDYTKYSSNGLISYAYYYTYTGSASVGSKKWSSASQEANLYLLVNHYTAEDRVGVSIHLGSGLSMKDSGQKASKLPDDLSDSGSGGGGGSTGGSGGSNIPEFAKQDCSICKGSGKCKTCGGRGYLYSSASKKYDRNCTSCHNADGKCTYCNGTGKR